jgi:hypothetical protein
MSDRDDVERIAGSDGKSYPASYTAHRDAIRKAIEADPSATNTAIAKRMKATRDTVIAVRKNLTGATMTSPTEQTDIDVFSLPVHPWAARFPMRSDDDLDAMAESIKTNGLRIPVALGKSVIEEGGEPVLCVIDGRNRIAACKRASVKPQYVMLNGEDQDAFIADANLERRDLTKGQKAMLLAVRVKKQQGKKSTSLVSKEVSGGRVSQARTVSEYCPEMIQPVIDGKTGLDEAYAEAQRRRAAQQAGETRYETLRKTDPDLADQVNEETLKLAEAEAAARVRREEEESTLRSYAATVRDISRYITGFGKPGIEQLARLYASNPERFHTDDLVGELDTWITIATAIREKIK